MPRATPEDDSRVEDRGTVVRLAVIGEYDPAFPPHRDVDATLAQVAATSDAELQAEWVSTEVIEREGSQYLARYHAVWISPGSPYRSLDGALAVAQAIADKIRGTNEGTGGLGD